MGPVTPLIVKQKENAEKIKCLCVCVCCVYPYVDRNFTAETKTMRKLCTHNAVLVS